MPCFESSNLGNRDHTVVWVRGDQDLATKAALACALARAALSSDADLVVDLSDVSFMDASTIGAIVEATDQLRSHSRSLMVRNPSACALRVFEVCGLTQLVQLRVATNAVPDDILIDANTRGQQRAGLVDR